MEHDFRLWSFPRYVSKIRFKAVRMIRGRKTVSNTILKHELCKLVIAKASTAITNNSTRSSKSGKERFQEFYDNSSIVSGEHFCFNPFRQVVNGHENVLVPSRRQERDHEIDASHVKDLAYLNCILGHFIFLRDFSLTLTSVTPCNQVMGMSVNSRPIKSGIKGFLSGVVGTMMSPGGSIMASREDINGFLALNTSSNHLIRTEY
ncbi:hypothetical protein Tco_0421225 [Tanacetum coccineum]